MKRSITVQQESWKLKVPFYSAYGTYEAIDTLLVTVSEGRVAGRGEARPFAPYGTSVESITNDIESIRPELESGAGRNELLGLLPSGTARNSVDCALWDLESKISGEPVWAMAHIGRPKPFTPIVCISAVPPEEALSIAQSKRSRPWFKVKLSGSDDVSRVTAVHTAAPGARIIVDPNCSWEAADYEKLIPVLHGLNVTMIEQPFAPGEDDILERLPRLIPICADESCTDLVSMDRLVDLYDVVSIKLDKSGGLTEALQMQNKARLSGLDVMVSCMISTSLALAPAVLLAQTADFADLDNDALLENDRENGVVFRDGQLFPASRKLWG